VHPAKEAELLFEISLLQRHDKAHEADDVESKADHAVVSCERCKLRVSKDNMLQD
jgi:hypothetical protein